MIVIIVAAIVLVVVLSISGYLLYRKFTDIDQTYGALRNYNSALTKKSSSVWQELNTTDKGLKSVDSELKVVDSELKERDKMLGNLLSKNTSSLASLTKSVQNDYVTKKAQAARVDSEYMHAVRGEADFWQSKNLSGSSIQGTDVKAQTIYGETLKGSSGEISNKFKAPTVTAQVVDSETLSATKGFNIGKAYRWRWGADDTSKTLNVYAGTDKGPTVTLGPYKSREGPLTRGMKLRGNLEAGNVDASSLKGGFIEGGMIGSDLLASTVVAGEVMYSQNALVAGKTPVWGWVPDDSKGTFNLWNEVKDAPLIQVDNPNNKVIYDIPTTFNQNVNVMNGMQVMNGEDEVMKTTADKVVVNKNLCIGSTCFTEKDMTKLKTFITNKLK